MVERLKLKRKKDSIKERGLKQFIFASSKYFLCNTGMYIVHRYYLGFIQNLSYTVALKVVKDKVLKYNP